MHRRRWLRMWRRLLTVTCLGLTICAAVAIYQGVPYLPVASEHGTASRARREAQEISAGRRVLRRAGAEPVWAAQHSLAGICAAPARASSSQAP